MDKSNGMEYKYVVASDLDGTLLAKGDAISEENEAAIKKMSETGVCFAPCSGRTFYEMPECLRENENIRYYIGSDGAAVWDKQAGRKVIDESMDKASLLPVLELLDKYATLSTVRADGRSYVDAQKCNDAAFEYHRVSYLYGLFIKYYDIPTENFSEFIRRLDSVEMICTFFRDEEELRRCTEEIKALGGFKITSSEPGNIEIIKDSAGKGSALISLAKLLGVPHEKTVAVGDSKNDIDMLKKAGVSLAMENASDEIKAVAHRTICHYKDHSAKFILENILEL